MYACSGILFNHESPLRPARFVTQKIVGTACRIAAGSQERLKIGNISIVRDWGWAPEYVDAMWRILQQDSPDDYVIATGESHSLQEFIAYAFGQQGLDWRAHTDVDSSLFRPTDIQVSRGDPSRANAQLGWKAESFPPQIVAAMIKSELSKLHARDADSVS